MIRYASPLDFRSEGDKRIISIMTYKEDSKDLVFGSCEGEI